MESKKELLHTQSGMTMDVEETNQNKQVSSELIKIKHVKETPFTIVTVEENKVFIALGQARMTDYKENIEECEEMINNKSWELIMAMVGRISEIVYKENFNINN